MKYTTILALCAPLLVACKPMAHERLHHHKRDGDAITSTSTVWEEVTVTVDVTVTVNAGDYDPKQPKLGKVDQDKPNNNVANPTPSVQAPVVQQEPAKPTTPPPPPPEQPAPAPVQEVKAPSSAPPPPPPPQQPTQPEQPKKEEPKKEEPKKEEPKKEEPKKQESSQGGSGPSGGACGEVGGKCLASDVTIYNDQGTGACGWANDTNSEDYFALAHSKLSWRISCLGRPLTRFSTMGRFHQRCTRSSQEQVVWPNGYHLCWRQAGLRDVDRQMPRLLGLEHRSQLESLEQALQ